MASLASVLSNPNNGTANAPPKAPPAAGQRDRPRRPRSRRARLVIGCSRVVSGS